MAEGITPNFQNQEEKNIVMGTLGVALLLGLTGYLGLVAPLVVYFGMQNNLSSVGKEIIRRFSNFQIILFLIALILPFTVIGVVLIPVVAIYGLIISILALLAIMNNDTVKIPVFVEFIKENAGTPITPQTNQEAPKDELKP